LRSNLTAARRFYQLLGEHLSAGVLARFAVVLSNCVRTILGELDPLQESFDAPGEGELGPEDAAGLMDVVTIIVTGLTAGGAEDRDQATFTRLQQALQPTLQAILAMDEDGSALTAAAMLIARAFPAGIAASVGLDVRADLCAMDADTDPSTYQPLLECAASWKMDADVIRLATGWVGAALTAAGAETAGGVGDVGGKKSSKGKKKTKDAAGTSGNPSLGIAYLDELVVRICCLRCDPRHDDMLNCALTPTATRCKHSNNVPATFHSPPVVI